MDIKYIILDEIFPVIFGGYFKHKTVSDTFPQRTTSAGFLNIRKHTPEDVIIETYGEAISLRLKPKERDAVLLARLLHR